MTLVLIHSPHLERVLQTASQHFLTAATISSQYFTHRIIIAITAAIAATIRIYGAIAAIAAVACAQCAATNAQTVVTFAASIAVFIPCTMLYAVMAVVRIPTTDAIAIITPLCSFIQLTASFTQPTNASNPSDNAGIMSSLNA